MKNPLILALILSAFSGPALAATKPAAKQTITAVLSWRNSNDNKPRMWNVDALEAYEDKTAKTADFVIGAKYAVAMQVLGESTFHDPLNDDDYPVTLVKYVNVAPVKNILATFVSFDAKTGALVISSEGETLNVTPGVKLKLDTAHLPTTTSFVMTISTNQAGASTLHSFSEYHALSCSQGGLFVIFTKHVDDRISATVRIAGLEMITAFDNSCFVSGDSIDCAFASLAGARYGQLHLTQTTAGSFPAELTFSDDSHETLSCSILSVADALAGK